MSLGSTPLLRNFTFNRRGRNHFEAARGPSMVWQPLLCALTSLLGIHPASTAWQF